jgi:hypothetical protein
MIRRGLLLLCVLAFVFSAGCAFFLVGTKAEQSEKSER